MSGCAKIKNLLSGYLDKETNGSENSLIQAHLDKCPDCRKEFSELSRIKDMTAGIERKTLPEDYLVCRLREKLAGERDERPGLSWLAGMGDFSRRLIPVPVTVILLSAVMLIFGTGRAASKYSIEEDILSGTSATTETVLGVILGIQN